MTVAGTTEVKENGITEVGAAVQVLILAETVEDPDITMSGTVVASPMIVPLLLSEALDLGGGLLLVGPPSMGESPDGRDLKENSTTVKDVSPHGQPADSRSPRRSGVIELQLFDWNLFFYFTRCVMFT